jgi:hypothetical protein
MDFIELPKYVYKYITWEKVYHKKVLLEQEIFFTSSRNFNDPFDSTVHFRYDYGTDEQILELYIEHIRHDHPNLLEDEVKRVARNELMLNDIRDPERIKYNTDVQREYTATKFGIFSVSTRNDNILMWSHYSNHHKGICVRFNCQKFQEFLETDCPQNDLIVYWNYIDYKNEYPLLNPFESDKDENYIKPLLIKSSDWKYENEFRFILFDYPNKAVIIPNSIIDQVILGCRISKENEKEIIEIVKGKNIELIQAVLKQNSFGLDFNKINV